MDGLGMDSEYVWRQRGIALHAYRTESWKPHYESFEAFIRAEHLDIQWYVERDIALLGDKSKGTK